MREQGSGLHVLFVEVAFDQTQTPYLTGRGGVVSGVCGNVLAVCGLEGVDTGSLFGCLVRKAPLKLVLRRALDTSLRWCRHS